MKQTVLANREDARNVESELQYEFVLFVIERLGVPSEVLFECFPEGGYEEFDVIHKKRLRQYMNKLNIEIIDYKDGSIKIYFDDELIAEWKKAFFTLRRDPKARITSKKLYNEIFVDYWTIFDDEEESGNE